METIKEGIKQRIDNPVTRLKLINVNKKVMPMPLKQYKHQ